MDEIIEAEALVKKFKDVTAVDGVDINVRRGEIYGFLGPNGAGKTTTIRMLTTISKPTSGRIKINGTYSDEGLKKVRKDIGLVQQQISLDKDISVRQNIIYHALLQKIPKKEIIPRLERLSEMMDLTRFLDYNVVELSGGWKRKAAIVCALIHEPVLLFLDEPTAGLDSQSRHVLWDLIRLLKNNGTTIFLTTHYIEEAEELCDRVAIIDNGKIKKLGSSEELCNSLGRIAVEYDGEDHKKKYKFFPDRESAKDFVSKLGEECYPRIRKTSLEDAFLECTGRKILGDFVKVVRV